MNSQEKIENQFLVDDLSYLGQQQQDLLTLIDEAQKRVTSANCLQILQNARGVHVRHLDQLQQQIKILGGEPGWENKHVPSTKLASLSLAEWFQSNSALETVLDKEQSLKLEYERGINQFVDTKGLVDTLKSHFDEINALCGAMKGEMVQLGVAV